MSNKETVYKQSEEYYRKGDLVIAREYGKHENGNMFGGCWVARKINTGEYVDNDRSRALLFERLGFKEEEFNGQRDPIMVGLILMLNTMLPTPGYRFWVPVVNGYLVIENRKGSVYFEKSGNKEYLDYLEVGCWQSNGNNGEICIQPQKFHPADVAEAVECFIGRAMSLQPTKEYRSKAADTLPSILAREKILRATNALSFGVEVLNPIPVVSEEHLSPEFKEKVKMTAWLDFSRKDGSYITRVFKNIAPHVGSFPGYAFTPENIFKGLSENYVDIILADDRRDTHRLVIVFEQDKVYCMWGSDYTRFQGF